MSLGPLTKPPVVFIGGVLAGGLAATLWHGALQTAEPPPTLTTARQVTSTETPHTSRNECAPGGATRADTTDRIAASGPSPSKPEVSVVKLQQSVVAALTAEGLAKYQPQLEKWTCDQEVCNAAMRLPATVDASKMHDSRAVAEIMSSLRHDFSDAGVNIALNYIKNEPEGMAMSFQFAPTARERVRSYTDSEIAAIRADTLKQYLASAGTTKTR